MILHQKAPADPETLGSCLWCLFIKIIFVLLTFRTNYPKSFQGNYFYICQKYPNIP
ncbi:hypothetical protein CBFG_06131 [Clostridiales bacterium 1_7_47FAA]|nr:hypothetical protein CBFG_06131 [Clostridiales bacterium 1_7_47FAA]